MGQAAAAKAEIFVPHLLGGEMSSLTVES